MSAIQFRTIAGVIRFKGRSPKAGSTRDRSSDS
jgi:hypothetical protein